jgi:hypothetical protein
MKYRSALLAFATVTLAANASAQTMKPGLWELKHQMKSSDGETERAMAQAQQQMANMPPEQRKMMQEMMAKQGVKMGGGGPGGMTVQTCVTKEMAERNEVPAQQGDCKTTKQQRSGNTTTVAFTCTNPPSSGESQFTLVSSEAYTIKSVLNQVIDGKPRQMNVEGSGKWLSADCGSIKPSAQGRK